MGALMEALAPGGPITAFLVEVVGWYTLGKEGAEPAGLSPSGSWVELVGESGISLEASAILLREKAVRSND